MVKSLRTNESKATEKSKQAIYQVKFVEKTQSKYFFFSTNYFLFCHLKLMYGILDLMYPVFRQEIYV